MTATEELDPVTQDMLIGQLEQLELFHWFVRAHLETAGGTLSTAGQRGEQPAADAASGS
jgi:starvation-inducible DNA-binding protein